MGRILAIDYGTKRTGLAVTDPTRTIIRQGRTAELGMVLGLNVVRNKKVPVFVVGLEDENIFHHAPEVSHFEGWEEVRDLLLSLQNPDLITKCW